LPIFLSYQQTPPARSATASLASLAYSGQTTGALKVLHGKNRVERNLYLLNVFPAVFLGSIDNGDNLHDIKSSLDCC
jgi:hypothetical protein